jgi:hypothetical protein
MRNLGESSGFGVFGREEALCCSAISKSRRDAFDEIGPSHSSTTF